MKWRCSYILLVTIALTQYSCTVKEQPVSGNQLANATSPYLKEHADNPVHWMEWGSTALEKAAKENKPIIISIGYASCHWCHVMEEESFMDTAVASIMNENFISIKIDREERPDIDQVYINAAQLITGHAGWPLNAFALPNGKPFYGGTYFPNQQWKDLLKQITTFYKDDYANVEKQANAVAKGIAEEDRLGITVAKDSNQFIPSATIFKEWNGSIDYETGGLIGAPKFPMPSVFEYLLQESYYNKNEQALTAVTTTLDAMANGGIYDHLAGGFARYSTDPKWKFPHFEKMLYDNAQLVSLYAHAYQVTGNKKYESIIQNTLQFIKDELTSPEGGFYSSINADSEGEEGKFYVWQKTEIEKTITGDALPFILDYYNIKDNGNWESGKNVLFTSGLKVISKEQQLMLEKSNELLLKERNKRIHPTRDNKILTSWNALMIKGYLDAYWALSNVEYLNQALECAQFITKTMLKENDQVFRSYSDDKATIEGFLDDYALLADAYINLYQATLDIQWLNLSKKIADYTIQHFKDSNEAFFFYSSNGSQKLFARKKEITDQVIPSSNSIMVFVLYKLGIYFEDNKYIDLSRKMVNQITLEVIKGGPYYSNWASLAELIRRGPYEVAVMGSEALVKSQSLKKSFMPDVLIMGGREENLPLLENKLVEGKTIIYVCRDKVCKLPVQEVDQALQQINGKK